MKVTPRGACGYGEGGSRLGCLSRECNGDATLGGTTAGESAAGLKTPSAALLPDRSAQPAPDISGIQIPLTGIRGAATYIGSPATGLSSTNGDGLLRGFMNEDAAETILLPDLPPPVESLCDQPLSSLFRGGAVRRCLPPAPTPTPTGTPVLCQENAECTGGTTCTGTDDRDRACRIDQTNAGQPCVNDSGCVPGGAGSCQKGWYFYINFGASEVPYADPTPGP